MKLKPADADRLRYTIGGVLFITGLASLFISPLSPKLALTYLLIGAVSSAFWISNDRFLAYVGAGMLVLSLEYAHTITAEFNSPVAVPWWQPSLVAGSAVVFVYFATLVARRLRRRP